MEVIHEDNFERYRLISYKPDDFNYSFLVGKCMRTFDNGIMRYENVFMIRHHSVWLLMDYLRELVKTETLLTWCMEENPISLRLPRKFTRLTKDDKLHEYQTSFWFIPFLGCSAFSEHVELSAEFECYLH